MKTPLLYSRRAVSAWPLASLAAAATLLTGLAFGQGVEPAKIVVEPSFASTNSVSDIQGVAHDTDSLLVNPWGLVPGPEGNLHVNDNITGVNTTYAPGGALLGGTGGDPHAVTVPASAQASGSGSPTGIVLNRASFATSGTGEFVITNGTASGPSHYIIVSEDGSIAGYNEKVNAASAVKVVDANTILAPSGYTGVTLDYAVTGTGSNTELTHYLYAANFRNGTVDVFDKNFTKVTLSGTAVFVDQSPNTTGTGALPANTAWSPFNVKHIAFLGADAGSKKLTVQRRILVAYALHSTTNNQMTDIPGYGKVEVFTPEGHYLRDLVPAGGLLNSPWGLAIAHVPVSSVRSKAFVLIGNHGDGRINAYAFDAGQAEGQHIGTFTTADGQPLAFDGLWALHYGPKRESVVSFLKDVDELGEDPVNLYYSAGIVGETHGLVGKIVVPHLK